MPDRHSVATVVAAPSSDVTACELSTAAVVCLLRANATDATNAEEGKPTSLPFPRIAADRCPSQARPPVEGAASATPCCSAGRSPSGWCPLHGLRRRGRGC